MLQHNKNMYLIVSQTSMLREWKKIPLCFWLWHKQHHTNNCFLRTLVVYFLHKISLETPVQIGEHAQLWPSKRSEKNLSVHVDSGNWENVNHYKTFEMRKANDITWLSTQPVHRTKIYRYISSIYLYKLLYLYWYHNNVDINSQG